MRLSGSVTIPRRPSSVGGIIGWARGVNRALQELRDRKIVGYKNPSRSKSSHPFKVNAQGDNTLIVKQGLMWAQKNNTTSGGDLTDPPTWTEYPIECAEFEITATAATGYVYLLCDLTNELTANYTLGGGAITLVSETWVYSGTPEIIYSTALPTAYDPQTDGRNFAKVLAKIILADGVASVENQYVRDNIPPIGIGYTFEPSP